MVKIQSYVSSLKEEIKERAKLIELLEQGDVFYQHQRGEAKIVVTVSYIFVELTQALKLHNSSGLQKLWSKSEKATKSG